MKYGEFPSLSGQENSCVPSQKQGLPKMTEKYFDYLAPCYFETLYSKLRLTMTLTATPKNDDCLFIARKEKE